MKIEKLIGSSAISKRDAELSLGLLDELTNLFVELNTADHKALFLAILHFQIAYKQYGKRIVRDMRSSDRAIFKRHIELPMNRYRQVIMEKGAFKIEEAVLDVLLYNSDKHDFKILLNLVQIVLGQRAKEHILDNPSISLKDEDKRKLGYGAES